MHVLGRTDETGPAVHLGAYRAADGSDGAAVGLDLEHPHAAVVVGKRGYGKSHTLGVLAEDAARTAGVAPVIVDPMGEFGGLAATDGAVPATVVEAPTVPADTLPPASWPELFDLSSTDPVGALLWEAASHASSLGAMTTYVHDSGADADVRRAARNHLHLADSWGVFDAAGLDADALLSTQATVLDCAGLDDRATAVLVRAVAAGLYETCVEEDPPRLPWLLIDEAHAFVGGVAEPALETVVTRGRSPGVSLVVATQRPRALPPVTVSQADLLLAHRLTADEDIEGLAAATPTYLSGSLRERLPSDPGAAVVVDDVTESVHGIQVRERETPDHGADPRVSARQSSSDVPQSGHSPSTTGTGAAHSGQ
ncbi:ATP-binding protein [Haloplanus halobius]|uniref:ATP-binding protein n=1 Tax=Haloplanus halobius TaxID=2934938 RepID=UPI00200DA4D4